MFYHFPKIQLREMKKEGEFFYKDTYISKTEDVRKVKIYILNLHYKVSLRAKFLAPNVSSSQDMDISKNVRTERAKRARNKRQLVNNKSKLYQVIISVNSHKRQTVNIRKLIYHLQNRFQVNYKIKIFRK